MAAPTDTTLKYYPGANGTPTNDTAAIGGAISTGAELIEVNANHLIDVLSIPASTGSDTDYYGIAYRKNEASGPLNDAYFWNRTAAIANTAAGVVQVQSTSASDTGVVRSTGLVSSTFTQGNTTCNGTTAATGSTTFDASGLWRHEYLVGGAAATPVGNITISVNGQIVAVIYGSASGRGNIMASREFAIAVASSQSATLSAANRLTAPSGISAFAQGAKWTGLDQSISVPGTGDLAGSAYIGYVVKLTVKAGIQAPVAGYVLPDVGLCGAAALS